MHTTTSWTRRRFLQTSASLSTVACLRASGDPRTASPWQIGCYTRPWDQFELAVALDGIAEAGYRYAGIMTAKGKSWVVITPATPPDEAARIGQEVAKRGLRALSVYGDFSVAESLAEGIRQLTRLVEHCAACGSPHLLLGGTGEEKLYAAYYQAIAEVCPFAETKGVSLSIKPHGGLNATGLQCRKAIETVGKKNFGLWYDPGNIYYYSEGKLDPVDDSATVDGLVVGMSVKDYQPPKEVLLTPGTGKVGFPKVFARLRQGGFERGPLIVECLARGEPAQVTAEAKKARRFLEQLILGVQPR
jgi:sugar phosphate isomerase/epimerase